MKSLATCLAAFVTLAAASVADASQLLGRNASKPRLAVSRSGQALVVYREGKRVRHVLAWGAINARHPSRDVPQVRFNLDFAGGWGTYRRPVWRTFRDACRPYDGPELAHLIAACKAPDGSYWALQAYQPLLPHRGYPVWLPWQTTWELHLSHWRGPLPKLEGWTDWAYGEKAHDLFGRYTYLGMPVHGFGTTPSGAPTDRYGRSLYIDTYDSAYGPAWKRETSIVARRPTGVFCYAFYPTRDVSLPNYPDNLRPAGHGDRYRITAEGPGVTPIVTWEAKGLPDYDPDNREHVEHERRMNELLKRVAAGDRFCREAL